LPPVSVPEAVTPGETLQPPARASRRTVGREVLRERAWNMKRPGGFEGRGAVENPGRALAEEPF